MAKVFTTTGICNPDENYMVNLDERVSQIRAMVDAGHYFTINRARQYGKTTTLSLLAASLRDEYCVLSLDFQAISNANFTTEERFVKAFCRQLRKKGPKAGMPDIILEQINELIDRKEEQAALDELFDVLNEWCSISDLPIVMLIDEVDSATNNQVFLDFLAQLRLQYIERKADPEYHAFRSVILAGVTDIKNLRRKIRPDESHKTNSPWNIAADFNIDMSLSESGIKEMLDEYEADHHKGMQTADIAREIRDYTGGYPFLVSRICQIIDNGLISTQTSIQTNTQGNDSGSSIENAWTISGVSEAVRILLSESNTLFDSLMGKVRDNAGLSSILKKILFSGEVVTYNAYNTDIADAAMYGFVFNDNGRVSISNRIFETLLYNYYLSISELEGSELFRQGTTQRSKLISGGRLNMDEVMRQYMRVFDDIYVDQDTVFDEAEGRRRFLLFLRPIINGTGNYYIESHTRNDRRMDLVVDYLGERHVVELKIWRGSRYHADGEIQLSDYLSYLHLDKGYLLTYSFNKNKQQQIINTTVNDKTIAEVTV